MSCDGQQRRLKPSAAARRAGSLAHAFLVAHTSRNRSAKPPGARHEPLPSPPPRPWHRRVPWTAVGISVLVLLSAAFAVDPLRDAMTLGLLPEAHLDLSVGYIALAPLSNVLDTLTLLGARQHIAVLVSALIIYAITRVIRRRLRRDEDSATGRASPLRESGYAALFLVAIVVLYAAALALPRPMAAIAAESSDVILVADFHAHTKYSHDGRPDWDPAAVRAWHRAAGFDVAFISDHRTVQGAEFGIADNPREAGQGTMLLQALEAGWRGEHVNVLGANRFYNGLTTPDLRDVDEQSLTLASLIRNHEPIVIETLPGHLDKVIAARGPGTAGVRAIEIVDGSPRGLDQTRIFRSRIVHLADSLNLALVAGSDNHGWGRAAPAWTLLIIPGWRGMGTDSLSSAIERSLRQGKEATRVVERRVAGELNGANALETTMTLPIVTWRMLTTLSVDERVMWIVWVWVLAVAWRLTRTWHRRRRLRRIA